MLGHVSTAQLRPIIFANRSDADRRMLSLRDCRGKRIFRVPALSTTPPGNGGLTLAAPPGSVLPREEQDTPFPWSVTDPHWVVHTEG